MKDPNDDRAMVIASVLLDEALAYGELPDELKLENQEVDPSLLTPDQYESIKSLICKGDVEAIREFASNFKKS